MTPAMWQSPVSKCLATVGRRKNSLFNRKRLPAEPSSGRAGHLLPLNNFQISVLLVAIRAVPNRLGSRLGSRMKTFINFCISSRMLNKVGMFCTVVTVVDNLVKEKKKEWHFQPIWNHNLPWIRSGQVAIVTNQVKRKPPSWCLKLWLWAHQTSLTH